MDKKTKALEGHSTTTPLIFDGSNYAYWKRRMRTFLISCNFDLWEVSLYGVQMDPKTLLG